MISVGTLGTLEEYFEHKLESVENLAAALDGTFMYIYKYVNIWKIRFFVQTCTRYINMNIRCMYFDICGQLYPYLYLVCVYEG
jgi:hypothetical protein